MNYPIYNKFPILISYAYARTKSGTANLQRLIDTDLFDIMLDSGAHTAYNTDQEIDLDEYCDFLTANQSKLFAYIALDVVNNPKATDINLNEMVRRGYKPMPVHVVGDEKQRMDDLFSLSDYVALAGCMRNKALGYSRKFVDAYIKQKMEWADGRKVHWLGYTSPPLLAGLKPYSCDSSSWRESERWGQMRVYGGNGQFFVVSYHQRNKIRQDKNIMRACRQVVSDWDVIMDDPQTWRSKKMNEICLDSWVRYSMDFRKMFGTRIFLAMLPIPDQVGGMIRVVGNYRSKMAKGVTDG